VILRNVTRADRMQRTPGGLIFFIIIGRLAGMVIRSDNNSYPFAMTVPSPGRVLVGLIRVVCDFIVGNRRYLFLKLANYLIVRFQQHFTKPAVVRGYPFYLTLDPVNLCNLGCPLCPAGRRKQGRRRGRMSFADFKKIIDELAPYLMLLDLFNWGEPFLNKDIFTMIDYAHRKGIIVRVSSNLNCFDDGMAEKLTAARCDFLLLSLYGASQMSSGRYQQGTDYSRVMTHLGMIRKKRKRLPLIIWRYLVTRHNEEEIPRAQLTARHTVDILEVSALHCDMSEEIFLDGRGQFENVRKWLPVNQAWSIYDYTARRKKRHRTRSCSYLYANPAINWDGSVSPCCLVWDEKYDFGNVLREGFAKVWNNKYFQAGRRLIFRGEGSGARTVCAVCRKNKAML
jgi:MoaA/NifB/PqqE/SkfB family radical SAM enzyme